MIEDNVDIVWLYGSEPLIIEDSTLSRTNLSHMASEQLTKNVVELEKKIETLQQICEENEKFIDSLNKVPRIDFYVWD